MVTRYARTGPATDAVGVSPLRPPTRSVRTLFGPPGLPGRRRLRRAAPRSPEPPTASTRPPPPSPSRPPPRPGPPPPPPGHPHLHRPPPPPPSRVPTSTRPPPPPPSRVPTSTRDPVSSPRPALPPGSAFRRRPRPASPGPELLARQTSGSPSPSESHAGRGALSLGRSPGPIGRAAPEPSWPVSRPVPAGSPTGRRSRPRKRRTRPAIAADHGGRRPVGSRGRQPADHPTPDGRRNPAR
jgi:formin 2